MLSRANQSKLYYESPSKTKKMNAQDIDPNSELSVKLNGYLQMNQFKPFQTEVGRANENIFLRNMQEDINEIKEREVPQTPFFGGLVQQQQQSQIKPQYTPNQKKTNYQNQEQLFSFQQGKENIQAMDQNYLYPQQQSPIFYQYPANENKMSSFKREIKKQFGEDGEIPLGAISPCPQMIFKSHSDNAIKQQQKYMKNVAVYYPKINEEGIYQYTEECKETQ